MFIPMDVVLILLLVVLLWPEGRDEKTARPPAPTPPAASLGGGGDPDFSSPPPAVQWLRTCQVIAQERGDWRMSDHYRDEANRLLAEQETARLAYNQRLRDRILKG